MKKLVSIVLPICLILGALGWWYSNHQQHRLDGIWLDSKGHKRLVITNGVVYQEIDPIGRGENDPLRHYEYYLGDIFKVGLLQDDWQFETLSKVNKEESFPLFFFLQNPFGILKKSN